MQNVTSIAKKTPNKAKTPRVKNTKVKPVRNVVNDHNRALATWILGAVVPLMSLALSTMFGEFVNQGNLYMAGSAACGVITILFVSLPHLVESIKDISGTAHKLSWALAIAFDSGIVLSELSLTFVPQMSLLTRIVCVMVLLGATLISGLLNVWAFQLERKGKRSK